MQEVKIRFARPSDFSSLLKESKTEWPDWWERNYKFGIEYTKNRIKEKRAIVAVVKGEVVGFLIFGSIWSRHIHIEDLYVKTRYRRLGIASMLIKELIKTSKKNGVRKIVTESDPLDKPAHKLNAKNGFRKAGYIRKLWGRTNASVFIKDLK